MGSLPARYARVTTISPSEIVSERIPPTWLTVASSQLTTPSCQGQNLPALVRSGSRCRVPAASLVARSSWGIASPLRRTHRDGMPDGPDDPGGWHQPHADVLKLPTTPVVES